MGNSTEKVIFTDNKMRYEEAKKSMTKYVEQLRFHFDLTDEEIFNILETIKKSKNFNKSKKKWWQFWK